MRPPFFQKRASRRACTVASALLCRSCSWQRRLLARCAPPGASATSNRGRHRRGRRPRCSRRSSSPAAPHTVAIEIWRKPQWFSTSWWPVACAHTPHAPRHAPFGRPGQLQPGLARVSRSPEARGELRIAAACGPHLAALLTRHASRHAGSAFGLGRVRSSTRCLERSEHRQRPSHHVSRVRAGH